MTGSGGRPSTAWPPRCDPPTIIPSSIRPAILSSIKSLGHGRPLTQGTMAMGTMTETIKTLIAPYDMDEIRRRAIVRGTHRKWMITGLCPAGNRIERVPNGHCDPSCARVLLFQCEACGLGIRLWVRRLPAKLRPASPARISGELMEGPEGVGGERAEDAFARSADGIQSWLRAHGRCPASAIRVQSFGGVGCHRVVVQAEQSHPSGWGRPPPNRRTASRTTARPTPHRSEPGGSPVSESSCRKGGPCDR